MFQRIAIIGAGQMGSGIAQTTSSKGISVVLIDSQKKALEKAKESIQKSAEKLFQKKMIDDHALQNIQNIQYTVDLQELKNCEGVIEAIIEDESIKKNLFKKIDEILPEDSFIASNTSSISITKLASSLKDPSRMIGMHFMNPVPIMKLVEIISGLETKESILQKTIQFAKFLDKNVSVSLDYPGFIVNRILMPMINEAFFTLMEGLASKEDIDKAMTLGTHQPMGPLTLADFIGLDTCLAIMNVLHHGFGDSKYRPCPLLVQYVDAGRLGRKVKKGVYSYEER